jgi:hypothetical protein
MERNAASAHITPPHIDAAVTAPSGNVQLTDDASKLWQGTIFVGNPPVSHTGTHRFKPCSVRDADRFHQWTLTLGAATYFYRVPIVDLRAPATTSTIPAHPLLRKISTKPSPSNTEMDHLSLVTSGLTRLRLPDLL